MSNISFSFFFVFIQWLKEREIKKVFIRWLKEREINNKKKAKPSLITSTLPLLSFFFQFNHSFVIQFHVSQQEPKA